MKKIIAPAILAFAAATAVSAQQTPTLSLAPAAPAEAKIVAELAAAHGTSSMKNSPVSFDEINESVQTLFDGNRIVRNSTGKFYRNSEGRIRREMAGGNGGLFGTVYSTGQNISILNPSIGQKYLLDTELKTARVVELTAAQRELAVTAAKRASEVRAIAGEGQSGVDLAVKLRTEAKAAAPAAVATGLTTAIVNGVATTFSSTGGSFGAGQTLFVPSTSSQYETRSEELGMRDFEGIQAEGTRRTTIIPAGAIGNERPIELVYERWYSKELGMVVYSKNTDPRFGEQTYRIANVVRSEPDPALFAVPTGYKRVSDDRQVYRLATPSRTPVTSIPVKAAAASARSHNVD